MDERESRLRGVVEDAGEQQLPHEFITIGKNFEEALGRCVIRDEELRNAIIVYKAQLEMFNMEKEIDDLTNYLNASAAIEGVNRRQALMGWVKIYEPTSAGAKTNKDTQKALMEMQKLKAQAKDGNNGNNGGQDGS